MKQGARAIAAVRRGMVLLRGRGQGRRMGAVEGVQMESGGNIDGPGLGHHQFPSEGNSIPNPLQGRAAVLRVGVEIKVGVEGVDVEGGAEV